MNMQEYYSEELREAGEIRSRLIKTLAIKKLKLETANNSIKRAIFFLKEGDTEKALEALNKELEFQCATGEQSASVKN